MGGTWRRSPLRWAAQLGLAVVFVGSIGAVSASTAVQSPEVADSSSGVPVPLPPPGAIDTELALPLGHAGRWVTDALGRVVIVHGLNEVYKTAPFEPASAGFSGDDAAFLASQGFNAVRVGVLYEGVEPSAGQYSTSYLHSIEQTVQALAAHGIVSILDFHQDLFSQEFGGEGFPAWSVQDDGQPNPTLPFPYGYFEDPALQAAFDNFWANSPGPQGVGLETYYEDAWQEVAGLFAEDPSILGYELMNEPYAGTDWEPCQSSSGCPAFDAVLTAFYNQVDAAIRKVDKRTLVWFEPNSSFDFGEPTNLGHVNDPNAGFAFHDYCLTQGETGSYAGCAPYDAAVFANADAYSQANGDAEILTEFGATSDPTTLSSLVARADSDMVGWTEWQYSGVGDVTTSASNADDESLVYNPELPPTGSNVNVGVLDLLSEPYPEVVAGTPTSYGYVPATHTFSLSYSTQSATGHGDYPGLSETDVIAPPSQYPSGFSVKVHGGVVISAPDQSPVRVISCFGESAISVSITPSGPGSEGC